MASAPTVTEWEEEWVKARVVLTRVGPAKKGDYRTVRLFCVHMHVCLYTYLYAT